MLSTIAEIQKGQGLRSGYEWLAGFNSFQGLYGRVSLQGLHGGSEYFRGPNIM